MSHRKIMERHLNRELGFGKTYGIISKEVVHHIDFNRINNHIPNLDVMTALQHAEAHRTSNRLMKDLFLALLKQDFIIFDRDNKRYKINRKYIKDNKIEVSLKIDRKK